MISTLRAQLLLIVGAAAIALLLTLAGSAVIGARQTRALSDVEQRLVPKLELGPRLETEFERLRQGMQDAVAAQDGPALEAMLDRRNHLFDSIAAAHGVIDPSDAALLRWSVHDYFETAHDVSRRLIAGETGENLIDEMARMQVQQSKTVELIKRTTGLSRTELSAGFAAVANANRQADRFRLAIGLSGLVLVLAFSLSTSRSVLIALRALSGGLSRFATGDFREKIPVQGLAELSKLAAEANQMAASLQTLAEQRDRADWLKEGLAKLSDELRGDLEPTPLAERAVRCLARQANAVAGALYLVEDGALKLRGRYALGAALEVIPLGSAEPVGALGGLLGEAVNGDQILVIDDPPEDYLKVHSGLGEGSPRALVFLPLARAGKAVGVVELALFKPCSDDIREFLTSVREMLIVGLQAAASRAALRAALERTQEQAERLGSQEEELRMNNQELQVQHEELRNANAELETQRRALSQQNAELEEARRRVQQKAEELAKMSSYKSQFLANMSHELRTPLNSMLLLSHLLADNESGNLTAKQVEYCKTIHSAGGDLLTLINQVLDLAKIEAGRQELELETVELKRFADYARRVFEPLAAEKGLKLLIELGSDLPPMITTDPQRVERIVTNLLGNAIKFTEQGEVALRIRRPAPGARFRRAGLQANSLIAFAVSDTGIGIAPEAQERVFAPFEQLESRTNRRYAGTGLGLAISRESALLLGGELDLESRPNVGSTFTCYVPTHVEKATIASDTKQSLSRVADDREILSEKEPHLLVIEDDVVLAEQLIDVIHARRFKALVATTGREGLSLATERRPRGIILDIKLPDIDGWAVMEKLRAEPATRAIPVHFISGVDAPERGLALGAVGYLIKPASHADLAAAVRALTPVSPNSSRRILVVEDSVNEGESLRALLGQQNFEVDCVRNAADALEALEKRRFGCMILDLGLPDMDGLAVLETLKAREHIEAPRVIVHTGRALNKRETQQLEAYAEAVVLKDGDSAERLLEEIRLFVSHIEEGLPSEKESEPPKARASEVSLNGVKLLLAEDDMRTVYAVSALLRGKGASVLVADTGREALTLLGQHPDLQVVLMDIMMPEMDGYDAMRELRRDPRFKTLPVIALTAKAMKGERERCLEAGANDYLTKPIDTEQLLATLRAWVPGGSNASAG